MILLLFRRENATRLFLPSLSSVSAFSRMLAFVSRAQPSERQVNSYHTKEYFESFIQYVKERLFQNKKRTTGTKRDRRVRSLTSTNHESWVLTCVIAISLTLHRRLARMSKEMVGLRHNHYYYHYHYHYHPCSNPLRPNFGCSESC